MPQATKPTLKRKIKDAENRACDLNLSKSERLNAEREALELKRKLNEGVGA